jgi:hypothetical protein
LYLFLVLGLAVVTAQLSSDGCHPVLADYLQFFLRNKKNKQQVFIHSIYLHSRTGSQKASGSGNEKFSEKLAALSAGRNSAVLFANIDSLSQARRLI